MKSAKKRALKPKLRFPEFRGSLEWEERRLSDFANLISERAGDSEYTLMSVTAGIGLVTQMEKFGKEIAGKAYKDYFVIKDGDFAYNKSATKDYPEGFISMLEGRDSAAVPNSIFLCFRVEDEGISRQLLKHMFLANFHGHWLRRFITVGARAHGALNVNPDDLMRMPIRIPGPEEQEEIADCLSSLDDLIAAQNQKLDSLNAHKQGLLQQLFPAEGETLPQLRFPEFQDSPEWEEKTVGQISGNIISGGTPSTLKEEYWNGNIRWMNSGELNLKRVYDVQGRITEEGLRNSSTRLIPERCVLIGLAGQGKTRGTVAMNMVELCTNQSIAAIFPNESIFDSNFLYHNLDNRYDELRRISTGGAGRGGLNLQIIKSLLINLPSLHEQERIADCLSSLDDLIGVQTQKIDALKSLKKGLMQQLFPSPGEVQE